jgi:ABC-type metal ion transport system substrate-binding protein
MTLSKVLVFCVIAVLALGVMPGVSKAEKFKIAVLQVNKDNSRAYEPLVEHLAKSGISVTLVEVPTYDEVTKMLSEGQVDAMFFGTGIPGSMFVIYQLKLKQSLMGFKPKESRMYQASISNR